ncbi:MAG: alpha/beta hydrolase [Deltaproteobacteria bacterium]|nr:alpha/beta hydrolase [Deltaproteobacteria bacterium]
MGNQIVTTGFFSNLLPYVCAGRGPETLVVLPHVRESLEDIAGARWCRRWLKRFAKRGHRVYIIGRRRSMPAGFSTCDMARDYAAVFAEHLPRAHILGVSLGGLVAQYLARDYPEHVASLILAVSAHRISPDQHAAMRTWISLAQSGDWQTIYIELARLMHAGIEREPMEAVLPLIGMSTGLTPERPEDFIHSLRASVRHDTADLLPGVKAKTLLVGGTRDRLFPVQIMEAAAALVPGAELRLLEGCGHGAFDEEKRAFDRHLFDFLDRQACAADICMHGCRPGAKNK